MPRKSKRSWLKPRWDSLVWLAAATCIAGGLYTVFTPGDASISTAEQTPVEPAVATSSAPRFPDVHVSFLNDDGSIGHATLNVNGKKITTAPAPETATLKIEADAEGVSRVKDGQTWDVALRSNAGEAYRDARVLAQADRDHAVVIGSTDAPKILLVNRDGSIREAYALGEAYALHGLIEGAFWLSTAQPGPGIESPPSGPSTLIRVPLSGPVSVVTTTADVISAVAIHGAATALGFEQGNFRASSGTSTVSGDGRPLVWLGSGHLLVARGERIIKIDLETGSAETVVDTGGPVIDAVPETMGP